METKSKFAAKVSSINHNVRELNTTSSTSTRTLAAAFSACINTHNDSNQQQSNPTPAAATSTSTSNEAQKKTTCLFCPKEVLLLEQESSKEYNDLLHKLMISLCKQLKISSAEIPEQCNNKNFPFCATCEELLAELWRYLQVLEEALAQVKKLVTSIERVVIDAEILGMGSNRPCSSSMAKLELLKFSKLRELILEGVRNKLLKQHQLQQEGSGNGDGINEPLTNVVIPEQSGNTETSSSLREGSLDGDSDEELPPVPFSHKVEPTANDETEDDDVEHGDDDKKNDVVEHDDDNEEDTEDKDVSQGTSSEPQQSRNPSCVPSNTEVLDMTPLRDHKTVQQPPNSSLSSDMLSTKVYKTKRGKGNKPVTKTAHKKKGMRSQTLARISGHGKKKPYETSGENNSFKCDFCKRRFGRKCNLAQHIKIHKPFTNVRDDPLPSTSIHSSLRRRHTSVGNHAVATRSRPHTTSIGSTGVDAPTVSSGKVGGKGGTSVTVKQNFMELRLRRLRQQ